MHGSLIYHTSSDQSTWLGLDVELPYIRPLPQVLYLTVEAIVTELKEIARDSPKAKEAKPESLIDHQLLKESDQTYVTPEIRRIEDLKGKTIGVTRFGSTTDFAARYALKKQGVEPEKDVALVHPRVPYETVEAVRNILDEAAETTPKAKEIRPETFIDNTILKDLDESGFIKKLYE